MGEETFGAKLTGSYAEEEILMGEFEQKYIDIINKLNELRKEKSEHSEFQRYISIAITEAQTARMRTQKVCAAK